jgi:hypothetical protein
LIPARKQAKSIIFAERGREPENVGILLLSQCVTPAVAIDCDRVAEINILDIFRGKEQSEYVVLRRPAPPPEPCKEKYIMRESIRRSCFIAIVTLLSFGPAAFAQARVANLATAPSFTSSVAVFVFNPLGEDRDDRKKRNKNKKVAASEGGSAALYVMFAGLACGSALLLRSRRTVRAKSV